MPELRKDPIIGRWVIIATGRATRPSDFLKEKDNLQRNGFCPFCPGSEQATPNEVLAYRPGGGDANGAGWAVRVVPNKFPALMIEGPMGREGHGIYDKMNGIGAHEVIIETPSHDKNMAAMSEREVENVVWSYRDRVLALKGDRRFKYILIFKNHGVAAGASLFHPHSQLIALPIVPRFVQEEMIGAKEYYRYKERCIFCDIVRQEKDDGVRVVYENGSHLVIAPYAPRFPFETWILPKNHTASFENCQKQEYEDLSNALRVTLAKLASALDNPPYNFIIHTSPFTESENEYYHWHLEIMPTLTKVAGFEWGSGCYINPTPPEEAAEFLRQLAV